MLLEYLKRGSYHTLFLGITSLFSRAILFLFLPYLLSKLTLVEFGIWDFYQHFFSLGTMVLSSGASIALTRFYILYNDEPRMQRQVIGNACMLVCLFMCCFLMLSPAVFWLLARYSIRTDYFFVSLMSVCFLSFFSITLAYLRVAEKLWWYATVFCLQGLIVAALMVLGLKYDWGISSLFYAHAVSLLLFAPIFARLAWRYADYSWPLLKEQIRYSFPLLVYNFIYMGFFTFDRLFLKYAAGASEDLGVYAILWRFGGLYQFFAISLANAAPIVLFNAQKEKNGTELIQKLLTYASVIMVLGGLCSMYATSFAIQQWFPLSYHGVIEHIPPFFMFLSVLEIARFMQTGFHLATRTDYIPILSFIALGVQLFFLWVLSPYGVAGICYANTCTFMIYAATSYYAGYTVYPHHIVDYKRLGALMAAFIATACIIASLPQATLFLLVGWVPLVWFGFATDAEKAWVTKWLCTSKEAGFLATCSSDMVKDHCYTNTIVGKRVVIAGPFPPPLGGISVHVKRVGAKLVQQKNKVFFFDTAKQPRLFIVSLVKLYIYMRSHRPELVYYHTPYFYWGVYQCLFLVLMQNWFSYKLVFVEHDAHHFERYYAWNQKLFAWCIAKAAKVIFIGSTPYIRYLTQGILPQQFSIESAFLPPDLTEKEKIIATYPTSLFYFIDTHTPLILLNAFQLRLLKGVDVYGYDMSIALLARVRETHPRAGLVFALATIGDDAYYRAMQQRAEQLGVAEHIFVVHGQKELWPLYEYADIFVRPTCTDNYGISVAEALFFGIPAVASDVCIRPRGTTLFIPRNRDDFYNKVLHLILVGAERKETQKTEDLSTFGR